MSTLGYSHTLTEEQLAWIRRQDAAGQSRTMIAANFAIRFDQALSDRRLNRLLGPAESPVRRPDLLKLSVELTPNEAKIVRAKAAALGYIAKVGPSVGQGNLHELMRAVAAGEVELVKANGDKGV